jgi:GT2 family glycosyltransferase
MRVTAVIPHWNRRDLLATLLDDLKQQIRPFDEVIVVDNGSSDDSAAAAEAAGARVLRLGRNLGFAAAVNRGIQAADSDWIAILNNDVTLAPDWLKILLETAARENASFATGKTLCAYATATIDGTRCATSAWRP